MFTLTSTYILGLKLHQIIEQVEKQNNISNKQIVVNNGLFVFFWKHINALIHRRSHFQLFKTLQD